VAIASLHLSKDNRSSVTTTAQAQPETSAAPAIRPETASVSAFTFGTGLRGWFCAATSFFGVLALILVAIQFIYAMYHQDMNDPDIWWHMRNAQQLIQHHQFPRVDTYSFTASGHPWINTEWLSEIPFYLAYRTFGLVGIKSISFFILNTIFLLLLYLCYQESRNFKASAAGCYYATFLATVSFGPRTILIGYVYLIVLLIILHRLRQRGSAPLWIIPPLFCLWANTHGSWSLGLILFFLIGVSGLVEGTWGRIESRKWTPAQLKKIALTFGASVLALFLNPWGWRLVYYPFDLAFKQKLNIAHVAEWVSVDFHDLRGKMVLVLILGLFAAALLRNRRWQLAEILALAFALYSGLTYIRFLVLLGIVVAPVLAQALDFFPPYRPELETPRVNMVVIAALIIAMGYFWPREAKVQRSIAETYPSNIVPYLKAHPPQGNVLNFYLWGGYLGWHDPDFKTFVDSRVDIFEYTGVLKDYLTLLGADTFQHRPEPVLDKYKIRYVLFPPIDSPNPLHAGGQLVYVLQNDPHWKTLYKDKICVLLERQ
jgi:multisubunit Na+/H+ antiporter MnhB subunit